MGCLRWHQELLTCSSDQTSNLENANPDFFFSKIYWLFWWTKNINTTVYVYQKSRFAVLWKSVNSFSKKRKRIRIISFRIGFLIRWTRPILLSWKSSLCWLIWQFISKDINDKNSKGHVARYIMFQCQLIMIY